MSWKRNRYATIADVNAAFTAAERNLTAAVATLNRRIGLMASQADVDALTQVVSDQGTTIQQVATDAAAAQTTLQTELDNLEAQINAGGTVDLSALQAAVAANGTALAPLDGAVQALGALVPTPPADGSGDTPPAS